MRTANRRICLRESRLDVGVAREEGQAEIGDFDHFQPAGQLESGRRLDQQQVRRLDIAMNDAGRGGMRESGRGLTQESPGDAFAERSVFLDGSLNVVAFDQLHHEKQSAQMTAEVISGNDIRMTEPGEGHRLLLESRQGRLVMHLTDKDCLHGHDAIEALLPGAINDAHSALGNQVKDLKTGDNVIRGEERFHDVDLHGVEQPAAQCHLRGGDV